MDNTNLRHARTHSNLGRIVTEHLHGIGYAHIFKSGDRWQLIITNTPSLAGSETEGYYSTKPEAIARAAALKAKPWNY